MNRLRNYLSEVAVALGMQRYEGHRLLVVQHLREDTLRLLQVLRRHVEVESVVGITYSTQAQVVEALRAEGVRVLTPGYGELERVVGEELERSVERCEREGQRLIIQEVGGWAVPRAQGLGAERRRCIAGAVEVTKQGVWRARALRPLEFPVLHCAESRLKEVEAQMAGEAVVAAVDGLMRGQGQALAGRAALVLGYGWIGRGVSRALQRRDVIVAAVDPDPLRRVQARLEGVLTPGLEQWLPQASLVVGTAGVLTVNAEVLRQLEDGTVLASGSSRDVEIDLAALRAGARSTHELAPHVRAYEMRDGRTLYLLNEGYPVNFIHGSVPDEVVELIFAEVLALVHRVATRPPGPGVHGIDRQDEALPAEVWLRLRHRARHVG